MFEKLVDPVSLQSMSVKELENYANLIADFLVKDTPYGVETIIENLNVLETMLAIACVYDINNTDFIFDVGSQSLIYRILMGQEASLKLRSNPSLFLKEHQTIFTGGKPGEGIGVAIGIARANPDRKIIVFVNDQVMNYGLTYESFLQLNRIKSNITIVLVDEQLSLLRHYNSIDALVKSIRISKTYIGFKHDMKNLLQQNSLSKPVLASLTRVRDAVKETVLEPTIFKHFGIEYQGPIDGHNLKELIQVFKVTTKYHTPHVIHIQSRLQSKKYRTLDFPAFKTDLSQPEGFVSYLEILDDYFFENQVESSPFFVLNNTSTMRSHLPKFGTRWLANYLAPAGTLDALVMMAHGIVQKGNRVFLIFDSSDYQHVSDLIRRQFIYKGLPLTIILRDCGLSPIGNRYEQGVFDLDGDNSNDIAITTVIDSVSLVDALDQSKNFCHAIIRIPFGTVNTLNSDIRTPSFGWESILETEPDAMGTIISIGTQTKTFKNQILINDLNLGLVHCSQVDSIDEEILAMLVKRGSPIIVVNADGINTPFKAQLYKYLYDNNAKNKVKFITVSTSNLDNPSRLLKKESGLLFSDILQHFKE